MLHNIYLIHLILYAGVMHYTILISITNKKFNICGVILPTYIVGALVKWDFVYILQTDYFCTFFHFIFVTNTGRLLTYYSLPGSFNYTMKSNLFDYNC